MPNIPICFKLVPLIPTVNRENSVITSIDPPHWDLVAKGDSTYNLTDEGRKASQLLEAIKSEKDGVHRDE